MASLEFNECLTVKICCLQGFMTQRDNDLLMGGDGNIEPGNIVLTEIQLSAKRGYEHIVGSALRLVKHDGKHRHKPSKLLEPQPTKTYPIS
jgi:hypothetical protein